MDGQTHKHKHKHTPLHAHTNTRKRYRTRFRGFDEGIGTYFHRVLKCIQMTNVLPYYTRPDQTPGRCK